MRPKHTAFAAAGAVVLLLDRVTKATAYASLPPWVPRPVLGQTLRWTLIFNRDAAMNLSLGEWSRWGFSAIAVVGIVVMIRLLSQTPDRLWTRAIALGMVAGGAAGNLIDRLRWDRGVIDFIDVGIGSHRFWTFNVADAGVTIGALVLAWSFTRLESPVRRVAEPGSDVLV